ncbi:hypothetical protein Hdeb2414_s0086g00783621 [Helianthus debilis subsp. tardiflorus]
MMINLAGDKKVHKDTYVAPISLRRPLLHNLYLTADDRPDNKAHLPHLFHNSPRLQIENFISRIHIAVHQVQRKINLIWTRHNPQASVSSLAAPIFYNHFSSSF